MDLKASIPGAPKMTLRQHQDRETCSDNLQCLLKSSLVSSIAHCKRIWLRHYTIRLIMLLR